MRIEWWTSYFCLSPRKIDTVASTEGSFTNTRWNRRSRALSASMFFLYSVNVVAPTQRSSPRANAGLSKFDASMAPPPEDAPAPTTTWTSSMNKMMFPSAFVTSSRTALRRSSNSPRYLAPAMRAPMSREITVFPLKASGTSPSATRWARPSAMAVFPTPGSPTSTGLFFVRRLKICTVRRISSSRPMTGSNFPSRADWVKSRP
mmetsp:Transcript_23947/g.77068  ORF Transcript_23947/g.77068 Transcript_23947/m.77068 type:complete len:204 (+) Transcript_23947:2283-2894(+)